MAKKRTRRPGGGRKAKGPIKGKTQVFATRITPETRATLEKEAETSNQSVSQVAEKALWLGLNEKRRNGARGPLRAICFLIENIVASIEGGKYAKVEHPRDEWRTDPFLFRAFEIALAKVLGALRPKGEISRRSDDSVEDLAVDLLNEHGELTELDRHILGIMRENNKSPENLGTYTANQVWILLNRTNPLTDSERRIFQQHRGEHAVRVMLEEFYGMEKARIDLDIEILELKRTKALLEDDELQERVFAKPIGGKKLDWRATRAATLKVVNEKLRRAMNGDKPEGDK